MSLIEFANYVRRRNQSPAFASGDGRGGPIHDGHVPNRTVAPTLRKFLSDIQWITLVMNEGVQTLPLRISPRLAAVANRNDGRARGRILLIRSHTRGKVQIGSERRPLQGGDFLARALHVQIHNRRSGSGTE